MATYTLRPNANWNNASVFTINGGSAESIKWTGAAAPTPTSNAGRIDAFTCTLIRLSSAWTVLGSANLNWG